VIVDPAVGLHVVELFEFQVVVRIRRRSVLR
jgi:hypothetical protein